MGVGTVSFMLFFSRPRIISPNIPTPPLDPAHGVFLGSLVLARAAN